MSRFGRVGREPLESGIVPRMCGVPGTRDSALGRSHLQQERGEVSARAVAPAASRTAAGARRAPRPVFERANGRALQSVIRRTPRRSRDVLQVGVASERLSREKCCALSAGLVLTRRFARVEGWPISAGLEASYIV